MRLSLKPALLAAVLLMAPVAEAQDASSPADDDSVTTVAPLTAEGRNTRDVIQAFVNDVSVDHERNGQVARFDNRVCPGVVNLRADQAQVLIDRIAMAALRMGLSVGDPGCEANVLVIITEDSDRLAVAMMEQYPQVFAFHVDEMERKHELLADFSRSGRPVRWWHLVSEEAVSPAPWFGVPYGAGAGAYGQSVHGGGDSRLRNTVQTDIFRVIMIVDTRLVGPIRLETLGDYLGMNALARLSPDAETGHFDTILNLFNDTPGVAPPVAMTAWDLAYMDALYTVRNDARSGRQQRHSIAWYMDRQFRENSEEAPTEPPEGSAEPED